MSHLPHPLDSYGSKTTSQNDEDGIIDAITKHVTTSRHFVEIGCDPTECNCLALYLQGWEGVFIDAEKKAPHIKNEWVSAANIMELLDKYQVPKHFGVLSIDIDGQDYWVWRELKGYHPQLVVIEYNGKLAIDHQFVIPRDDNFRIKSQAYGASLLAMNDLATSKGYWLVYANGVNGFFVDRDILSNTQDFQYEKIYRRWPTDHIHDPSKLGFVKWREL